MIAIRPWVKMNKRCSDAVRELVPYTGDDDFYVTSCVRDPTKQLGIINTMSTEAAVRFKEFDPVDPLKKCVIDGQELYCWQQTWSRLLAKGFIVNPPLAAKCLEEYKHPTKGIVPAGALIQGSPHTKIPEEDVNCFDMGSRVGLDKLAAALELAKYHGIVKDYLIERNNNAIHVTV